MYGTFTKRPLKASPLQTSEQKLLTGNLRPYATWLGNLMGLGVGGLSYVLVYQTVKRQLTNPADLLKGRKSMRAAIESARPLPPSLTPRRFYAYMAPHKITRSSLREFNRLYARTVLIHWLALTWAVVFASIAQPLLESKTICDFVPRSGKHPKEAKVSVTGVDCLVHKCIAYPPFFSGYVSSWKKKTGHALKINDNLLGHTTE